jgi:hypothetical protein
VNICKRWCLHQAEPQQWRSLGAGEFRGNFEEHIITSDYLLYDSDELLTTKELKDIAYISSRKKQLTTCYGVMGPIPEEKASSNI